MKTRKKLIVGHGLDLSALPRSAAPANDAKLTFLTIGRLSPIKRVDLLIKAFAHYEHEARFLIAGSAGEEGKKYDSELKELVRRLNIEDKVVFLGDVVHDTLPDLFRETHIFLHASETGSLDKASLEPLACGIPLITTNKELGQAGCEAIIPVESDASAIAEAIRKATNEKVWARENIRESARRYIEKEHDLTKLIPRILGYFEIRKPSVLKTFMYRSCLLLRDMLDPFLHFEEISILAYHSISNAPLETAVSPEAFMRHIDLFREHGFSFVSIRDVIAWRTEGKSLPRKAVALTFDDGYEDFETTVMPILERYSIPATLFIVGNEGESRKALGNDVALLTAESLEGLKKNPLVNIGYHSRSHANVSVLSESELRREGQTGQDIPYFAYPGGKYSVQAAKVLKDLGYAAAFSIKPTLVHRDSDLFILPRNVITKSMRDADVRLRASLALDWIRYLRRFRA